MTRIQFLTITCAMLLAPACSSGPTKGTSGTSGATGEGSSGSSGTAGASSGTTGAAATGGTGATTAGSSGGSVSGGNSSGSTTGPAAPDFALSTALSTLTLPEGGQATLRVNIQRDAGGTPDSDTLIFALAADAGVSGMFNPLFVDGGATALMIGVADTVPAGSYPLTVYASSVSNPQSSHFTDLTLTVSSEMVTTLLIDNDDSENNADGGGLPSPSDDFFMQALQSAGTVYNTFVITSTGQQTFDSTVLANYATVVWYTGANSLMAGGNGCLSSAQEDFLEGWLDQGGKQLLMFSPYLLQDLDSFRFWSIPPDDQFLSLYVGAEGCDQNPQQLFDGKNFFATGVDGTAFGAADAGEDGGEIFEVVPNPIPDTAGVINPGDGGTLPLVTIEANEVIGDGTQAVPTAVINTSAGQAGTSTVVYVGIPIEDIQASDAGSGQSFFNAVEQSLP